MGVICSSKILLIYALHGVYSQFYAKSKATHLHSLSMEYILNFMIKKFALSFFLLLFIYFYLLLDLWVLVPC